ncbi:L-carnitine dehydrogenase [Rhodobacteraceae bacterium THAF1]|uniref:thioesterase family protein n=1 Tax=Palleronia sp. THAF1 TaxID=2587842 RepID=UPI000F3E83F9|nr:thioesterase family protein [Palleronia sp. THAF1]QFU08108.1 L-carnitine dehydrogenase [Palleronia sp. THAF1]VDC27974.1 L-carnitine dehydrogenase [Rhodobacteraceae bacterium THAF1]
MRLAVLGLPDWAARAAVMGADVRYCGPDPKPMLRRAAKVLPGLYDRTPPAGDLTMCGTPDLAVDGADLILTAPTSGISATVPVVHIGGGPEGATVAHSGTPAWLVPEVVLTGPGAARIAPLLVGIGVAAVDALTPLPTDTMLDGPEREAAIVGSLRALREANVGPGRNLAQTEALWPWPDPDWSQPVETADRVVPLDWLDYNGHMTEARYLHAFGNATDRLMHMLGCTPDYIAAGHSFFTAETHIRHIGEANAGDRIRIHSQALMVDGAKMRFFHMMRVADRIVATSEHFMLHVSLKTRRSVPPLPPLDGGMARFGAAELTWPDGAGRAVGQPR